MKKNREYRKAWESALRLLNYRERSIKELEGRLREKHYSPPSIDAVIKRLLELDLLDDRKFARLWTRSRIQFKPRSAWLISRELREKGIEDDYAVGLVDATGPPYRLVINPKEDRHLSAPLHRSIDRDLLRVLPLTEEGLGEYQGTHDRTLSTHAMKPNLLQQSILPFI